MRRSAAAMMCAILSYGCFQDQCTTDADCDDGIWCNGEEECTGGFEFSILSCSPGIHPCCDYNLIPGLALLLATSVWVALLLGTICARFRDVPQIAASLMQVAFFLTPIIWQPEQIGDRLIFVQINPFFHFIELIRAPLLGNTVTALTWAVTLAITLGGWLGTLLFYRLFRARIAYWVS